MGIVKFFATAIVLFALLTPVSYAGGLDNSGVGTTAMGMAGAFRAVANDWSAAFYNPAGYAYIKDNQLGGSMALVHVRDDLTPNYRFGGIYETGIYNDRVNYNDHKIFSNPSSGLVIRFPYGDGEIVGGLSAYQPYDNNISWTLYDLPLAYNDSLFMPRDQYTSNIDVVAFQLTLAKEIKPNKLAIGIGLQLLRADIYYTTITFRNNPLPAPFSVRPYDHITEWSQNDGYGFGFGMNAGLMYKLNDKMTVGVSGNIPSKIKVDGSARLQFYMPKISTLVENPDTVGVEAGTVGYLFAGGSRVIDSADFKTDLKLPASFGIGLSYKVRENFVVELDAQYTLWSRYDGLKFNYSNHQGLKGAADTAAVARQFFTTDLVRSVTLSDAGKVMLGAKYDKGPYFTFMGGVAADQSPERLTAEFMPQLVDTGDKYSISGGAIWHYGQQWDFGISGTYTHAPDLKITRLVDWNSDGFNDSFPGTYKASRYETVLSVNYRF